MDFIRISYALFFLGFAWVVPAESGVLFGKVEIRSKNQQPLGVNSGVVVYLKEVNGNKGFSSKTRPAMASENMKFSPDILPILVGTSVVFPNKDDSIHNAFSTSEAKKFDFGRYGYGEENSVSFDKPGVVNVFCKIHPQMAGTILVLENPYFTTTDENGNYTLKDIPAGNYTLVSWFPFGNSQEKKVELTKESKTEADFSLVKLRNSNPRKTTAAKK